MEKAIKMVRRDARKHPSPNSGFPESAVAGALGFVSGRKLLSRRDLVPGLYGDPERPLKAEHIRVTNRLLLGVSVLFTLLGTLVLGLVAATGGSLWL